MKERIVEIIEMGQPKSLIQRENTPTTELIKTDALIEELNEQLRIHAVVGRSEQLRDYFAWHEEKGYVSHKPSDIDEFLASNSH